MRALVSLAALTSLAVAGCSPTAASHFTAIPLTLDHADPQRVQFGRLSYRGGLRLSGDARFGGFSALVVDDGDLLAISDTGYWARLALDHDTSGWLLSARLVEDGQLRGLDGQPMRTKAAQDAEGAARDGSGIVVSFERTHRVWRYAPDLKAVPTPVAAPPPMRRLPDNGGVEAMTELADGRLLLISERGGTDEASPGWIGRGRSWQPFFYLRNSAFRPTGASLLPDGRVLVMERRILPPGGRLVLIDPKAIGPEARVTPTVLAILEAPLTVDNFEGVAVTAGRDGHLTVYIISDDNFSFFQSTLLLSFHIH